MLFCPCSGAGGSEAGGFFANARLVDGTLDRRERGALLDQCAVSRQPACRIDRQGGDGPPVAAEHGKKAPLLDRSLDDCHLLRTVSEADAFDVEAELARPEIGQMLVDTHCGDVAGQHVVRRHSCLLDGIAPMLDCDEMPVIGNERPMRASAAANTPGAGDSSPLSARQNASQRRPRALVRSPEPSSHSTLRTAPSATMTRSL